MGIASYRKKTGLSQRKVAKILGITDAAVAQWESGKTRPRVELLPKVAALYGVTIDELLQEDTQQEGRPQ